MNFQTPLQILAVVFGVGLVIFVHELGHFLAARRAGARVEIFSIGIGPRLFGWRRGDTMFQIAALPLGGFVKVAGEYPVEGGRPARPGELGAMSVWSRLVYYSGGVVMNLVFAFVALPLVLFSGLPVTEPVFGTPERGSPAWRANIEAGTRVLSINGRAPIDFGGVRTEVALSGRKPVELEVAGPDGTRRSLLIESEYDEDLGFYRMGVRPDYDAGRRIRVATEGAAARAGLVDDQRLLGVVGQPPELLPEEQLQQAIRDGGPVTVIVADAPEGAPAREVVVTPEDEAVPGRRLVGISSRVNLVEGLRAGPATALGLRVDDRLLEVDGRPVWRPGDVLTALLADTPAGSAPRPVRALVERGGSSVTLEGPPLDRGGRLTLESDLSLIADVARSAVTVTDDGAAARAGLRNGDRIVAVSGEPTADWQAVFDLVQALARQKQPVPLEVERGAGEATERLALTLEAEPASVPSYGFALAMARGVHRATGVGDAIRTGGIASWRVLVDTWLTLKKMVLTDEVSTKNLGGIITISVVSYETASQGWQRLLFFLAILSINLAILNILPIPILDGGHLLFLLVEAVKGSPVSERTLGYSQVVGLVLLLSLMIYVTYQDVVRWIIGS